MIAALLLAALQGPEPATLLRCAEGSATPCLTTRLDLDPGAAGRVGPPAGWRARFRRDTGLAMVAEAAVNPDRPSRVFVVLDVSGSMKGDKNGTARFVLKQFLRRLDSIPGLQVAVAPFGSVEVESRIGAARFGPPRQTLGVVDRLPAPDRENTALYSATALAADRLGDEVKRSTGLGLLVVLTDGNNDVGLGDDPGLLAEASGLAEAARRVEANGIGVGIVGIGDLDGAKLRQLAGSRGEVLEVSGQPGVIELSEPLGRFARMLEGSWRITVPLGSTDRADLGRGFGALRLGLGGGADPALAASWRPPFVALPAFEGSAPDVRLAMAPAGADRWLTPVLLAAFLLVLLAGVWLIFPRAIWPRVAPIAAAAKQPKPVQRPGSLRTDLTEVAPRKPTDITASRARPR